MKHSIKHSLPLALVKTVATKAIAAYQEKFSEYEAASKWVTDNRAEISFVALKKKLEGTIDLSAESIDLELDVPFLFRPFQGKAIEIIEREIKEWLGKAERGELEAEGDKGEGTPE